MAYVGSSAKVPKLWCPVEAGINLQVIIFERPRPLYMQYFSLTPISLSLGDKPERAWRGIPPLDDVDAEEAREKAKRAVLIEKLKLHTIVKHAPSEMELALSTIIAQINCSHEIGDLLSKNSGLVGTKLRRSLSVSERVVESATNLWEYVLQLTWHVLATWMLPITLQLFIVLIVACRGGAEVVLQIIEWRLRPSWAALKDVSATAQQLDIRLQQFCYWPIQYLTLRRRKNDWQSTTNSHAEYIRFYNSLWLVANDIIIGVALGSYIIENSAFVASQIDHVGGAWSVEGLRRTISWLMGWPAGLKLNTELAVFLGDLFLWVIDYWAGMFKDP